MQRALVAHPIRASAALFRRLKNQLHDTGQFGFASLQEPRGRPYVGALARSR